MTRFNSDFLVSHRAPFVGRALIMSSMLLLLGAGCAEEDAITTVVANDMDTLDMIDRPDVSLPVDMKPDLTVLPDMPSPTPDMPGDLGDGQDMPVDLMEVDAGVDMPDVQVGYELCALGQRAPWGECLEEDLLEFGRVPAAQVVERIARIDNDGDVAITVTQAAFSQMEYQVAWRTYDRAQPPMATDRTLPYTIEPGESLFAIVSLFGGLTMAELPDTQLEIKIDTGGLDLETATLQLTARYDGCGLGLASCDMDVSNGCEVNITTDISNCGGCGIGCALDNATALCAASSCLIDSCDQGFGSCDGTIATGCETNTDTSMQHCGGCDQSCDYDNASAQCDTGSCVFQGCLGSFANCDGDLNGTGCESDTNTSLAHCGGCAQPCAYSNATETCDTGSCVFQGCEANYYNLNGDLSDGCEYFCVPQGGTDLPDAQYTDNNCDGIDGDVQKAVFVAKTGNDGNAGTMGSPFRTISKGLNVASTTSGITQVLVAEGSYEEQLFLVNGTHLAGGYETTTGWARSVNAITRSFWRQAMSRRIVAMSGTNITSPSSVSQMTVEAEGTTASSTSTYGIYCQGCTGLTLTDNIFIAGDAGDGDDGVNGTGGATNSSVAGRGQTGGAGSCNGSGNRQGGAAGVSVCSRNGGRGGNGGSEGDNSGVAGSSGFIGTPGGGRGVEDNCDHRDGGNGSSGSDGGNGSNGGAGSGGALQSGYWVARDGSNGSNGSSGNGGGGGGGGSGQGGTFCDNGAGNGGGGGGAGGCGGNSGGRGTAGGSSFAAFLYQSTGITLESNSMRAGNAGAGGRGGNGGNGSLGISGGSGGTTCLGEVGRGGNGGGGGDGGDGGHGGGGAGGNSYGIWRESTTVGMPGSNVLTFGQSGAGGTSAGNSGSTGASGTYR